MGNNVGFYDKWAVYKSRAGSFENIAVFTGFLVLDKFEGNP